MEEVAEYLFLGALLEDKPYMRAQPDEVYYPIYHRWVELRDKLIIKYKLPTPLITTP